MEHQKVGMARRKVTKKWTTKKQHQTKTLEEKFYVSADNSLLEIYIHLEAEMDSFIKYTKT